jgi:MFS family permease
MKLLSAALSSFILLTSPGLGATEAFAQVLRSAPAQRLGSPVSGTPVVPGVPARLSAPIAPSFAPTLTSPSLALPAPAAPRLAAPASPAAAVAPAAQAAAAPTLASPVRAAVNAALPEAAPAAKADTVLGALSADVETLGKTAAPSQGAVLQNLFTGSRSFGAVNAAVEASGADAAGRAALETPATPESYEPAALDSKKPLAERKAAVAAIAKFATPEAKAALIRVGEANPAGGAEDYEVHRAAYKALAESYGEVRSLRAVSPEHKAALMKGLKDNKPALAVFDYDDTLQKWKEKASPATGAALKAAADAGVSVAILTDRPALPDGGSPTVIDSLADLTAEQKAAVTIAGRAGAEMAQYDAKGREAVVDRMPAWTEAERKAIEEVAAIIKEKFGAAEHDGKSGGVTDYGFFRLLPVRAPQATLDASVKLATEELGKRGMTGLHIFARYAKSMDDPPYIQASKVNKQRGMAILRGQRAAYERLRDLRAFGLPAKYAAKALSWLRRIPEAQIPAAKTLVVGDQFFASRNTDSDMAKATPGALVLSVGAKADPRIENIFVWPSEGHAATQDILGALGQKADDGGFNKKATIGLFLGRTLSIGSFVLTAIAYPFVAAPAVGWATFGTLMALGPLAAIATGPLNGALADKFSARTSMTINMVIRAVLAMALPTFAYFGIINFWTLLIASIANGWALSATMTTETAYVRRIAGKHQNAVQALISVNFVALQVVLGLLVGIGSYIDSWAPTTPFLISAIAHAAIAAPLMWFTMPSDKPQGNAAAKPAAKAPFSERAGTFAKKYWKEALITAASIGSYAFFHSALPIAGALFYWVLNTDTVKALRAGDYREVSAREKEIEAALKAKEGQDTPETAALKKEAKVWKGRQFKTVLYSAGQAVMTYPFQNFALPLIAVLLVGTAGKGLLLGKLLGAMYFGNLIANSSQANLPEVKLPLVGRIPGQRLVQALVLGLAAGWVYTGLIPGSILAAAAAVGIAAALMWLSGRITNRGWIKALGFGLAGIALPAAVWAFPGLIPFLDIQTALFLAMLNYGLFVGPSSVSLGIYQQGNTNKAHLGKVFGTGSSFFNTFNSLGYGLLALAASAFTPAFPMMFLPMLGLYAVGGYLFFRAPKNLPGLPEKSFKNNDK